MSSLYISETLLSASVGDEIVISGAEAKHAVSVSRIRLGESILVSNGAGLLVHGLVEETASARLVVRVTEVEREPEPEVRLILVQALAKGGRDELAIQTATELGVSAVIPWAAERSVSKWTDQKIERGRERWQTITREASKQAIRSRVPIVATLHTTRMITDLAREGSMFVLEPTASEALSSVSTGVGDVYLVVGPEGGISPRELSELTAAGARPVKLGAEVLRTSSAGPAALAVLNVALRRW